MDSLLSSVKPADSTVNMFTLHIPHEPQVKQRPRVTRRGFAYTPGETISAERLVQAMWRGAGCPRLPDEPLVIRLQFGFVRPKSHFNSKGELNSTGLKSKIPGPRKDWDNLAKLICDALNGKAWKDDSQFVFVSVSKIETQGEPYTDIIARVANDWDF